MRRGLGAASAMVNDRRERMKRTTSDQRLAELEALATLVRSRAPVGHGRIDPFLYGKRKRVMDMDADLHVDSDDRGQYADKLIASSVGGQGRESFMEDFMDD